MILSQPMLYFKPATLDSGSTKDYVDRKNGDQAISYLWGTQNSLKDTYGTMCYQEQLAQMAREIGGFSLGEGVKLVKFISKKKVDKIKAMKGKFFEGAKDNGCPKEDAESIWNMMESGGSYLFNKSHATAYGITAYIGAWIKANYPVVFYTVSLEWVKDELIPNLISEMEMCSDAKLVPPDINESGSGFYTDYSTNEIYWSLTRIKMLGQKAVEYIVEERSKGGKFTGIQNFIERIFKYKLKKYEYWDDPDNEDEVVKCPVNARHVKHLIMAGCFDKVEGIQSVIERYCILTKAAELLGFEIKEKDIPSDLRDKHYFWSQQQIILSGVGSIDYKRMYDNSDIKPKIKSRGAKYVALKDMQDDIFDSQKGIICASIAEIEEHKYTSKDGKNKVMCKIKLQQNNDLAEMVIWDEEWNMFKNQFYINGSLSNSKNKVIIAVGEIRYSAFTQLNVFNLNRYSKLQLI